MFFIILVAAIRAG